MPKGKLHNFCARMALIGTVLHKAAKLELYWYSKELLLGREVIRKKSAEIISNVQATENLADCHIVKGSFLMFAQAIRACYIFQYRIYRSREAVHLSQTSKKIKMEI